MQPRFKTHLIIPDAHAKPGISNSRFELLGKHILATKPDVIINIGDFADMESLSSYDKGKKSAELRRYKKDVKACHEALDLTFGPMISYNKLQRKNKKQQYKPRTVTTSGNHEHRLYRVAEFNPELDDILSMSDLGFDKYFQEVYPYMTPVDVDGIMYCHVYTSGVMGRPIGGESHARKLIQTQFKSCVQGHSHLRDFCERTDPTGKKIQGLVVGCFLEEDQWEDYAGQANLMWWKGLVELTVDTQTGSFDPKFIGIEQLREMYK